MNCYLIFKDVKKKYLTKLLVQCILSKVMQMERFVEQALLYDFYGELLTENQKNVYEDVVLNDYSLSEVAEEKGISRQGVHDLIKRTNKALAEYEEKLHLVEKFLHIKEKVSQIQTTVEQAEQIEKQELIERIESISNEILEEL